MNPDDGYLVTDAVKTPYVKDWDVFRIEPDPIEPCLKRMVYVCKASELKQQTPD